MVACEITHPLLSLSSFQFFFPISCTCLKAIKSYVNEHNIFLLILFANALSADTGHSNVFDKVLRVEVVKLSREMIPLNIDFHTFDLKGLTQNLAYVGVVHVREGLEDLAPLVLGPHHECVHWPFNVGLVVVPSSGFPEDSCLCRSSASCWPTIIGLGFICRAIYFLGPCNGQSRNKKRERGRTLIKWRAMFELSFIYCHRCYHHHEHCFRWVQGHGPSWGGRLFHWVENLSWQAFYFMCYKSEHNVSLTLNNIFSGLSKTRRGRRPWTLVAVKYFVCKFSHVSTQPHTFQFDIHSVCKKCKNANINNKYGTWGSL